MLRRQYVTLAIVFSIVFICSSARGAQADSTVITFPQAERQFLDRNLELLAAKFNIEAATAVIAQAELWPNPNLAVEQNVYNKFTDRWFDVTKTGNTEFQLQQLFLLAGKRDKQIKLAQTNAKIAEQNFYDLLRALRSELRSDMFDLYFLQQSLHFYDESISTLRKTVSAVETIYENRSILLSDVLRLKSLLYSLENERLSFLNRTVELQASLRLLLHDTTTYYIINLDKAKLDSLYVQDIALDAALATAMEHRPSYKIAEANVEYEATNLALQKALSIPDLTLGARYSRQGSYIPDYLGLTLSFDLPFFNRNQGNIQVSERTLEGNRLLVENARKVVDKEVTIAFQKAVEIDRLFKETDKNFPAQYEKLIQGVVANYHSRNISLLEFTDFYESYRTSMVQWYQLQSDRADAIEALNFAVSAPIITTQ